MDKKYLDTVQLFLNKFTTYWEQMLSELDCHQIQLTAGNRLRPQNCFWGFVATFDSLEHIDESEIARIAYISVSIEMIHKASLLIDDWIDQDDVRHGNPAFHAEYTPEEAVLTALNMIGYAMIRLQNSFRDKEIILPQHYFMCFDSLLNTIYGMARGALQELKLKGLEFYDIDKVKDIIQLETSEMLGNCMLLGYYAGKNQENIIPEIERGFRKIGDYCGFLFQIMNDMEAFSNPPKLYEHKGNLNLDILKKRKNYGIAVLYDLADSKEKSIIARSENGDILFRLIRKYRVKELIAAQIHDVYVQIEAEIENLGHRGVSPEWCTGYSQFLEYIKAFGENRL